MNLEALLKDYACPPGIWDEMSDSGNIRHQYSKLVSSFQHLNVPDLQHKDRLAGEMFMNQGITFTVYSDNRGIERIFPFDIIPRIITSKEWEIVEKGIQQRLKALNMFLKDVYNEQQILKDNIIPQQLIASCPHYLREVQGIKVPHDIYIHISGIDLIRGGTGSFIYWKITCAPLPASVICWRTGKSLKGSSPTCLPPAM